MFPNFLFSEFINFSYYSPYSQSTYLSKTSIAQNLNFESTLMNEILYVPINN